MSYKIEKNTVQETLIIPLYARKICSELYPSLYRDETAIRLVSEADYDFSALDKKSRTLMQRFGSLEVAAVWTIPGAIAITAAAKFIIWISQT